MGGLIRDLKWPEENGKNVFRGTDAKLCDPAFGPELIRLPWSDEVSRRFGERKARLEKAGRQLSDFDLAIAVHALAYGLTLVSADRAFERLRLRRENWLA